MKNFKINIFNNWLILRIFGNSSSFPLSFHLLERAADPVQGPNILLRQEDVVVPFRTKRHESHMLLLVASTDDPANSVRFGNDQIKAAEHDRFDRTGSQKQIGPGQEAGLHRIVAAYRYEFRRGT